MESPDNSTYLESPMEGDDVAYPCKGCGGDVSVPVPSTRGVYESATKVIFLHRSSRREKPSNLLAIDGI
ncbi:hypothetical protein DID88_005804 [Monilinia fructigena]|uniref:Uncharacterized protein n=1 Tax=Monilinia fructigena TaxID=38457 RepID=A0A395J0W4_9HELO|nr:hypothetical protein DID88_005804 [Monilinia fructigena]